MQRVKSPVQRVTTPENRVTPFSYQKQKFRLSNRRPRRHCRPDAKKRKSTNQARPLAMPPAKSTYDLPSDAPSPVITDGSALRDGALPSSEATLRSLSKAKDNRFLPVYQFAA